MTPKKPDPIGSKSVIQENKKLNQELKIKTKIKNQIKTKSRKLSPSTEKTT
tara:strand:- start:2101 stop:2253 length:153 start_codon:yes stop_codon:yes gene_type:complete